MFEFEVDHRSLSVYSVPDEVIKSFPSLPASTIALSLLPWEEHCTECAMPMCYSTCNLYAPRKDGKCRRFVEGITSISDVDNMQGYLARVAFKRWGQLMTYANLHAVPVQRYKWIEKIVFGVDAIVSRIPDGWLSIKGRSGLSTRLQRRLKQIIARNGTFSANSNVLPAYLLIEVFNPNSSVVNLTLTVNSTDPNEYSAGFQQLLALNHGYNQFNIKTTDISQRLDLTKKFGIALNPNIIDEKDEGLTLYFGMLNFVWDSEMGARQKIHEATNNKPHVKVVVWDLDNTLWDGILLEDGLDKLKLKPGIMNIIVELDKRGILNSVASKNNHDDALRALDKFGLTQYMLFPQIGWDQKGLYVQSLVKQFNVAENTFAFIDDQPFERDEVLALNPQVRVYDALEYNTLLERDDFNPPVSSESHMRREFYSLEKKREQAMSSFSGEYSTFLKECEIKLNIYTPTTDNIERIMELVQRTNQLNFSGNRYSSEKIAEILSENQYDAYCLDCEDRYGQYGTVGFAIVNKDTYQLIDLMFSCRVQSKRVEHAFLAFLLEYYRSLGAKEFSAVYIKTDRNMKAGAVFEDMKFIEPVTADDHIYKFDLNSVIPDDKIIHVLWDGKTW